MIPMVRTITRCVACAAASVLVFHATAAGTAQPSAAPSTQPAKLPLGQLRELAYAAYDAEDYAAALPLLKELAVRLRNDPGKVAPILEQVRVCEANVQSTMLIEGINTPRIPHVKPADGTTYQVELQKLGNFPYEQETREIPDDVRSLDGVKVRIKGYMQLVTESESITRFQLVPDRFACCFGQPPQVQHTTMVVCPPGTAVKYFPEEIYVEGILKVGEKSEEGFVLAIFEIAASSIRPAEN